GRASSTRRAPCAVGGRVGLARPRTTARGTVRPGRSSPRAEGREAGPHHEGPPIARRALVRRAATPLALLFELAFDGVVRLPVAGGRARGLTVLVLRLSGLGLLLLVHELADLLRRVAQVVHRGLDARRVVALQGLAQRRDLLLDVLLRAGGNLVAEVAERLLDLVGERIGLVARLDPLDVAAVLLGVGLRLLHQLVDLLLREAARGGDGDVLLLAGRLVARLHVEDAVPVDDEPREALVVGGELALALDDVDLDLRLTVARGREDLGLRGRDGAVALDELGRDAAERLDAQRERRDVEEEDVLHLALEHAGLDRRAHGDDLVRVHALVRLLAEELLHGLDDERHARHAADEDDLVDLAGVDARVREAALHRLDGLLHEIADE